MPAFYAGRPVAGKAFDVTPALAGRGDTGSTRKQRLAALADEVRLLVADDLRATPDPVGLRVDVGLPDDVPLLASNDLDSLAYPLVSRLGGATGRRFVSVWVSKRHARTSSVAVLPAHPVPDPGGSQRFQVRTTASIVTTTFRQQIRNQITAARPLPYGGIALQLSFVVGPRRAWPNLWKVTIDSLRPLLGHPAGGRITDLGLHCVVDPAVGHDIGIAVRANPARFRASVPKTADATRHRSGELYARAPQG
ncbi:hypothetical protein Aoc01nite_60650 [Actinoplanes octamycinicus]|nr:hypothetical protein Aoc01nite_60650 [Actinoplanes octamycinicus]